MPGKHIETQAEWESAMAKKVFAAIRGELYLALPYMNAALCALTPAEQDTLTAFATDGARLCFAPGWLLGLYRKNHAYLPRAYLHSVLHCVFRHLWLRGSRDPALWGLACDIAVEHTLDRLGVPALARPVGWLRSETYRKLAGQCRLLGAGPIYRALCGYAPEELARLQEEFFCDSHRLWPKDPDAPAAQMQGSRWEQLGRQTQLSMQQAGSRASAADGAAALAAQVQAGQSRRQYRDFLRRFAVWREEPRLDPDEFDLGYYSYGLRTYGNLPLIEPLETRETKRVRDFAIVLDTSESTSGELVKAFLKETFTLLKSADTFFAKCRVLVLQCDDAVRGETFLTDLDSLDRYARNFVLKGGGGTDFRPAFRYVDGLVERGEFAHLPGLLYFTDGYGVFPDVPPAYRAVFVMLRYRYDDIDLPAWAEKLILEAEAPKGDERWI